MISAISETVVKLEKESKEQKEPKKLKKQASKKASKKLETESSESARPSDDSKAGGEATIFLQNVVQQCSKFFLGLHEYCNKYAAELESAGVSSLPDVQVVEKKSLEGQAAGTISEKKGAKDGNRKSHSRSEKKVKKELNPELAALLPKKPMAPYFLYLAERRPEVAAQRKDLSSTEVVEHVAKEWRKLEQEKRDHYMERFKKSQKEYNELKDKLEGRGESLELEVSVPPNTMKPSADKDLSTKEESRVGLKSAILSDEEDARVLDHPVKIESPAKKSIIAGEQLEVGTSGASGQREGAAERNSESTVTITSDQGTPGEMRNQEEIADEDSEGEEEASLGKRQVKTEPLSEQEVGDTSVVMADTIRVDSSEDKTVEIGQTKVE